MLASVIKLCAPTRCDASLSLSRFTCRAYYRKYITVDIQLESSIDWNAHKTRPYNMLSSCLPDNVSKHNSVVTLFTLSLWNIYEPYLLRVSRKENLGFHPDGIYKSDKFWWHAMVTWQYRCWKWNKSSDFFIQLLNFRMFNHSLCNRYIYYVQIIT